MAFSRRSFFKGAIGSAGAATLPVVSGCASSYSPFLHGVASGDPLSDRVILWTRITPLNDKGDVKQGSDRPSVIRYQWLVATDPVLNDIVHAGSGETDVDKDYTVKIDVLDLLPGTTYYYRFEALDWASDTGRTKTLPVGDVSHVRLAMTSCTNYTYGYFNVYAAIANRQDLDAVLHLGDYIYEYGGSYSSDKIDRVHSPDKEIISLSDYRLRHAQYKTDQDLQRVHQQFPFITIWDDHETSNDAWAEGAQNHDVNTEGEWLDRRAAGIQAYFEWMPIRENGRDVYGDNLIYRDFRFGDLLDLIMLDTRLAGRTKQPEIGNLGDILDADQHLLGEAQQSWLFDALDASVENNTQWRMLGQQVMMAQFSAGAIGFNMDQWDGYPLARQRLHNYLIDNEIDNMVVLTGDIHSSWASDITPTPFVASTYDKDTGEGAIAVEFVTPAVTSPGIENYQLAWAASQSVQAGSPHIKYVEYYHRGYVLLDVTPERIQGEWYHMRTITRRSDWQFFARGYKTMNGKAGLVRVDKPSKGKSKEETPAYAPTLSSFERMRLKLK